MERYKNKVPIKFRKYQQKFTSRRGEAHPEIVQCLLTTNLELGLAGQLAEALFTVISSENQKLGSCIKIV